MDKNDKILLTIFALVLITFAVFSSKIDFHDSYEYVTIAKHFAGIKNVDLFSGHSLLYPFLISIFLKIYPSLITIRLVNVMWIFLIGFVFLSILKSKKSFIIFAFSPIIWYTGIQTTPILPASFFFFISFIFFNKPNLKYNHLYSGILLGLSCAFYTPMILVSGIFILFYFWDKSFFKAIFYLLYIFIGYLPRLIQDYYLFNMPVYSLIRFAGSNLILTLGRNPTFSGNSGNLHFLGNLSIFFIFIVISPLIFRLVKIDLKKYKRVLFFLLTIFLIFFVRASLMKYFLIITPLIIILLSKVFSAKDVKWHCLLSILIIVFLINGFFGFNQEIVIKNDLNNITNDFDIDYIIAGPFESIYFSAYYWKNDPYFVWYQDYKASVENKIKIRGYDFSFDSKIPLKDKLVISASFNRFNNKSYDDFILVTKMNESEFEDLRQFELIKCYEELCVYEK